MIVFSFSLRNEKKGGNIEISIAGLRILRVFRCIRLVNKIKGLKVR